MLDGVSKLVRILQGLALRVCCRYVEYCFALVYNVQQLYDNIYIIHIIYITYIIYIFFGSVYFS